MLSDFFTPLNLITFLEYVFLILFFDIVGTFFKRKFISYTSNENGRILNWLFGLGIFVFIWFCLSLFVPYTTNNLLISMLILSIFTIYPYFKNNEFNNYLLEIWKLKVPILIILPFIPAVIVKASLPPYYADEMAYHFISPFSVMNLSTIKYIGGIYSDLPRTINLFYELIFSLTKTYSIARLFHFTILLTSMLYAYKLLKSHVSVLAGFLFVFIFFSLPQDIVLTSTLGYIDVAAYSLLLVGLVSSISFLFKPSNELLLTSAVFWAMNLGTKYTGVSTFMTFVIVFSVAIYLDRKIYSEYLNLKVCLKILILMLFFGGYWYLKNFILFGNPIFPFIFNCWGKHVEVCPQSGGFFGNWTTSITFSNAQLILNQLFIRNKLLHILVLLSPLLSIFIKNKRVKVATLFLFVSVVVELLVLKYFSGFYIRYHQHLQLFLLLGIVLTVTAKYKNSIVTNLVNMLMIVMLLTSILFYIYTIKYTNSLKFLNWNEINYSLGKMSIYDWIDFHFPRMKYTIRWCESKTNGEFKKLARFDPDLIWFDYDGLKRVFLLNCEYINPAINSSNLDKMIDLAVADKLEFIIASKARCIKDNEIVKLHPNERDDMLELRKINNKIICNSTEIEPYLYKFDYRNIHEKYAQ